MSDSEYTRSPFEDCSGKAGAPESGGSDCDNAGGSRMQPEGAGSWKALLVILLSVFAGLAGLAYYASHWKKEIVVREVVIEGARVIPRSELVSELNGFVGRNLQDIDVSELRERLLGIPYLRKVSVSRELNGILRVRVAEREPIALTLFMGNRMVIDDEGLLLPETREVTALFPDLIRISGITHASDYGGVVKKLTVRDSTQIRDLIGALRLSEYAGLLINEIHLDAGGMTYCRAKGSPTRFILGSEGNFKEKLKKFEIFWQKVVSKKGLDHFDAVDLRFRDRVFTRGYESPDIQQEVSL